MSLIKVLAVLGVMHLYLWFRLIRSPQLPTPWKQIALTALCALGLSMPIALQFVFPLPLATSRAQLYPIYTWLGVVLVLVPMLLFTEPVRLAVRLLAFRLPMLRSPRLQLRLARGLALAATAAAVIAVIHANRVALDAVPVKRLDVTIKQLDPHLDGTTIVQLSDLHIGASLDRLWLKEIVRKVNELHPDVVAITGDLVDNQVWKLGEEMQPLGDLHPKHGTYWVTGNHEYYFHIDQWIKRFNELSMHYLHNEHVTISDGVASYTLAGVDDLEGYLVAGHGTDVAKALKNRDPKLPTVLLAHRPGVLHEAARLRADLVLAGHTHGGQIWPWGILLGSFYDHMVAGVFKEGETTLYVNQGTGWWGPPMRLGSESEITRVVLHSAKKSGGALHAGLHPSPPARPMMRAHRTPHS